jgi:predicted RNase H-like HicB family nuclease
MVIIMEQEFAIASRSSAIDLKIEVEQEVDGRWIAEVLQLPGVLAYGPSPEIAVAKAQALALRVLADRTGLRPEDL